MEPEFSILCLSDLHGYLPDLCETEPVELAIIAGDICPTYTHDLYFQKQWVENDFIKWAENIPARNIIFIAGNHDFVFQQFYVGYVAPLYKNITYLQDSEVVIKHFQRTFKIWGSPWSNLFGPWAFMTDEAKLAMRYDDIPSDTDIIISHGPPNGFGDKVLDGSYVGSTSLRKRIKEVKPSLVVTGHIHEAYGEYSYAGTQIVNASLMNEFYVPVNKPLRVTL